ncbi:MAG: hypothetical protein EXX96DRAFT_573756 [Benjaminiella poitrasii]|nr:MAG: hypothetical protein EXX96DRAFT_573756 [Benjaminiella poitrasii]
MAHVPNEILAEIVSHLTFSDKLTAVQTCQGWYQAIGLSGKLYETLTFYDREDMKKAIRFFKRRPHLRDCVLALDLSFNYDATEIAKTFPNIKRLRWGIENDMASGYADPDDSPDRQPTYRRAIEQFKQLETVVEKNGEFYPVVVPLLRCGRTAQNLTSITFHFFNDSPTNQQTQMVYALTYREKVKTMLLLFRFAPRLRFLELSKLYLTLHDMEDLHDQYAPQLQELVLKNMLYLFTDMTLIELMRQTFKVEHGPQPVVVTRPAATIRNVYIDFSHNIDRYDVSKGDDKPLLWLEYVCRKYVNASSVAFGIAAIDETFVQRNIFQSPLVTPTFAWTQLRCLDVAICGLTEPLMTAMDAAGIRLETLSIYFRSQSTATLQQTTALLQSRQRESITELFIKARGNIEPSTDEGQAMYALAEGIPRLKHLDVTQEFTFSGLQIEHGMVPHLLLRAPQLEGLFIEKVSVAMSDAVRYPDFAGRTCRLKQLGFGNVYCRTRGQGEVLSKTLNDVVLPVCPALEKFDLYVGRIGGPFDQIKTEMVLRFDFVHNPRLSDVEINYYDDTYFCIHLHGQTHWWLQDCPGAPFEKVKKCPEGKRYVSLGLQHSVFLNDKLFS